MCTHIHVNTHTCVHTYMCIHIHNKHTHGKTEYWTLDELTPVGKYAGDG